MSTRVCLLFLLHSFIVNLYESVYEVDGRRKRELYYSIFCQSSLSSALLFHCQSFSIRHALIVRRVVIVYAFPWSDADVAGMHACSVYSDILDWALGYVHNLLLKGFHVLLSCMQCCVCLLVPCTKWQWLTKPDALDAGCAYVSSGSRSRRKQRQSQARPRKQHSLNLHVATDHHGRHGHGYAGCCDTIQATLIR